MGHNVGKDRVKLDKNRNQAAAQTPKPAQHRKFPLLE